MWVRSEQILDVHVDFVCKRTHDTGYIPSDGQLFFKTEKIRSCLPHFRTKSFGVKEPHSGSQLEGNAAGSKGNVFMSWIPITIWHIFCVYNDDDILLEYLYNFSKLQQIT